MKLTPLYLALCQARIAHPGWAIPRTHYSPGVYVRAGGPLGAFNRAFNRAPLAAR